MPPFNILVTILIRTRTFSDMGTPRHGNFLFALFLRKFCDFFLFALILYVASI